MDDVGSDEEYSQTFDSDIEDQISEAHDTLSRDKHSLRDVISLADEVTSKGETLARKASETDFALRLEDYGQENAKNRFGYRDNDETSEISERSYERILEFDGFRKEKIFADDSGLGKIEYLPTSEVETSNDESDVSVREAGISKESQSNKNSANSSTKSDNDQSESEKLEGEENFENDLENFGKSSEVTVGNDKLSDIESVSDENCESSDEKIAVEEEKERIEIMEETDDGKQDECSQEIFQDCIAPSDGSGDGQREYELLARLKKLRDDISAMRQDLSNARKECSKESEEVTKLIEGIMERNKLAENMGESAISSISPQFVTPPRTPPSHLRSMILDTAGISNARPLYSSGSSIFLANRLPAVVPTAVLEERLRATRETASTTYRATLDELERMVEKEMASIQDSMTLLEPLNQMASEWNTSQQLRSMTYKRDYRMEMVTSEMHLHGQKVPVEEIK
ncbi:Hypothetical protein NTJ_14642 [Nesidiocoris tenuis]|uniref:Uncharacterized protein n=1 Tax=Nesidiocoris tenuis TaxID=355587 RepID=A0ABN7BDA6_9HEMI|nr:Hypothetical protein NTJ_14642 [Nesidiocoris tenuis]